jgi:hypothetical protein
MEYRCRSDEIRLSGVIPASFPGVMDGQNGLPNLLRFAEGKDFCNNRDITPRLNDSPAIRYPVMHVVALQPYDKVSKS